MAGVVRAHDAAKEHELKLIVGAEFRTLDDLHVVLLAPTQTAYAEICALITRARLAADKGKYRLTRADFQSGLEHCLALWVPPAEPRAGTAGMAARAVSPDAAGLQSSCTWAPTMRDALRICGNSALHMACRWWRPATSTCTSPERRALQDTLTAIRHRCTLAAAGHRLYPNGERHLRSCEQLREDLSARAAR